MCTTPPTDTALRSSPLGAARTAARAATSLLAVVTAVLFSTTARAGQPQGAAGSATALPDQVQFNRDIRPILADTCFKCHGPDKAKRKAKLGFDTFESATADLDGHRAIVPGDAGKSEAVVRLASKDPDQQMPPPESGLALTPRQIALFTKWVAQGARYQEHWAFVPPRRPELPEVRDATWVRNPIDRFVRARLEQEGLSPSPEAPSETLIRRVTLDLTGLPPTRTEVDAFLADHSPGAYEKVVDRLLASPAYGERMAGPWLDAARYADTSGYQADWERHQWPWRDWVVKAFNDNLPFDRFTVEQLAGDLLPNPTIDQRLATGFNRNHRVNDEGGIIPEEYAAEYVIDRVDTTGAVFLGLTVGCCRCHDHKFDPISQKEFYRLVAYFNNVPEKGQDGRPGYATPMMRVPRAEKKAEVEQLERQAAEVERRLQAEAPKADDRLAAWDRAMREALASESAEWTSPRPASVSASGGPELHLLKDGSVLPLNITSDESVYTVAMKPGLDRVTALRLDVLTDDSHPGRYLGRGEGNFVLNELEVVAQRPGKAPAPVKVRSAAADYEQAGWPASAAIDGKPKTGWAVDGDLITGPRVAVFTFDQPVDTNGGATLTVRLKQGIKSAKQLTVGRLRLSVTRDPRPDASPAGLLPEAVIAALRTEPDRRTADQSFEIADYFRTADPALRVLRNEAVRLRRRALDLSAGGTPVMVMREMPRRRPAYLLRRGQYDKADTSEVLSPGVPSVLLAADTPQPKDRLELARWLVWPDNPLTARVAVNRFWQLYFGTGLVKTAEDFGLQGEFPSHPELLDWLATEFVHPSTTRLSSSKSSSGQGGWDVKAMQRLIVTSATYRQSSQVTPALLERDPDNRLLARGPRLRLDALAVRDNALAIAGLLSPKLGGPPVKPYQPAGLWEELAFTDKTTIDRYVQERGEGLYRRTLYTFFKRTVPPPAMAIFDAAGRETCTVRLPRTNTPLQALNLLNDVTYVEAARVMAGRVLHEGGASDADRVSYAFRLATARTPEERERQALLAALEHYRTKYQADPAAAKALTGVGEAPRAADLDPVEHAAYAALCNVILNLDATITKE